jgi:hypothetical protein
MKTSLTKPKHSLFNGARSPPQASFLLINSCRLTHAMPCHGHDQICRKFQLVDSQIIGHSNLSKTSRIPLLHHNC